MDLEEPITFDNIQRCFCWNLQCHFYCQKLVATNCLLEQEYITPGLQYYKENEVYR